jgi:hypothetical protein
MALMNSLVISVVNLFLFPVMLDMCSSLLDRLITAFRVWVCLAMTDGAVSEEL